jgi:peptide deformylase
MSEGMSDLRLWPDPILARPSVETRWLPRDEVLHTAVLLRRAVADLAPLGIAANQIGRPGRIVAFNRSLLGLDLPDVVLDPVVERASAEMIQRIEGCLSLPGVAVPVCRPAWIHLAWTGFDGQRQRMRLKGLAAACALHEIDHLDGRTILDRRTPPAPRGARGPRRTAPDPGPLLPDLLPGA